MIIVMGVTLYTSRVVLNVLGFDEYGLYNVVAGVVVLFTFLNGSMTTTTQRYLCVGLGKNDVEHQRMVFHSSIKLHFAISLLFLLIAEPTGLWMIYNVLKIPNGLYTTANIVYQLALLTAVLNIIRVPFNAAIIAHEKMDFYAYSSIIEAALKLLILLPLIYMNGSKVILYGLLVLIVQGLLLCWYISYTYHKFHGLFTHSTSPYKEVMIEMLKFTGWSNFSSIANITSKQGFGIIANIFLGVIVNAAIGIMNQVTTAVYTFITNFQTAINPPLIKYYAQEEFFELQKLFILSAKFSFYLMLVLSIPIIINIDSILNIWLTNVPQYTPSLCVCALISLLPNVIGGPVWTMIQASGNIRRYQTIIGIVIFSNLPVDWFLLELGFKPYVLLIYTGLVNLTVVIIGIRYLSNWGVLQHKILIKELLLPISAVSIVSIASTYIESKLVFITYSNQIFTVILNALIMVIIVCLCVIGFGMTNEERKMFVKLIHHRHR